MNLSFRNYFSMTFSFRNYFSVTLSLICQTKLIKNELGQKPKAKFLKMTMTKQKKIHNCLHFNPFLFNYCEILKLKLFFCKIEHQDKSQKYFFHTLRILIQVYRDKLSWPISNIFNVEGSIIFFWKN